MTFGEIAPFRSFEANPGTCQMALGTAKAWHWQEGESATSNEIVAWYGSISEYYLN